MRNLIAAVYFLLSMFGCNGPGDTFITHTRTDGVDTLYSRTHIATNVARFECLGSSSGRCYYTLFAHECTEGAKANTPCRPFEQFTMAIGDRREVVGLPAHFNFCVSHEDRDGADCSRDQRANAASAAAAQRR